MTLREYRVLFQLGRRDRAVVHDDLGLRTKFGGEPDWDQGDETPGCPSCKKTMTFVAQLDSIEHDAPNNPQAVNAICGEQQFMFGGVGMIYVFFCFDCGESKSVFQCG